MECMISGILSYFRYYESPNTGLAAYPEEILIEIFRKIPRETPPLLLTCKKFHRILMDHRVKSLIIKELYPKISEDFKVMHSLVSYSEILDTENQYDFYELLESKNPTQYVKIACKNKMINPSCQLF